MPLHVTNWRPLTICSLLVAQKVSNLTFNQQVWDDRYLSNADFAFIYPFFTTDEINKLEQKFLELIQYALPSSLLSTRYNVTVKASLYAKYYYELRELYKYNEKEFPLVPLSVTDMSKLEIRSHKYQEAFSDTSKEKAKMTATIGSIEGIKKEKKSCGFAIID